MSKEGATFYTGLIDRWSPDDVAAAIIAGETCGLDVRIEQISRGVEMTITSSGGNGCSPDKPPPTFPDFCREMHKTLVLFKALDR